MNNYDFDEIIEDLRTQYAELNDSYDYLMLENERLKVKVKMLENQNRILTAKLKKSENSQ